MDSDKCILHCKTRNSPALTKLVSAGSMTTTWWIRDATMVARHTQVLIGRAQFKFSMDSGGVKNSARYIDVSEFGIIVS